MKKNENDVLPESSTVEDMELLEIPIDQIAVYANQPRKEFNEEGLAGLANSTNEVRLQNPVSVRLKKNGQFLYELIDGERRLRAHKMLGKTTILALVKKINSEDEQFVSSVVSNFCRAVHTPLEIANALQRILEWIYKNNQGISRPEAMEKAAKVCGRSYSWVAQHLGLLNLCPEVRGLMEKNRIPFQIGVALTTLKSEHQISFANHIIKREFGFKEALNYIRTHVDKDKINVGGRKRSGSKNYAYFQGSLKKFNRELEIMANLIRTREEDMFKNRSSQELRVLFFSVTKQLDTMKEIKDVLEKVMIRKKTTEESVKWAQNRETN